MTWYVCLMKNKPSNKITTFSKKTEISVKPRIILRQSRSPVIVYAIVFFVQVKRK